MTDHPPVALRLQYRPRMNKGHRLSIVAPEVLHSEDVPALLQRSGCSFQARTGELSHSAKIDYIDLDLSRVANINLTALGMLVLAIKLLASQSTKINISLPINPVARAYVADAGFAESIADGTPAGSQIIASGESERRRRSIFPIPLTWASDTAALSSRIYPLLSEWMRINADRKDRYSSNLLRSIIRNLASTTRKAGSPALLLAAQVTVDRAPEGRNGRQDDELINGTHAPSLLLYIGTPARILPVRSFQKEAHDGFAQLLDRWTRIATQGDAQNELYYFDRLVKSAKGRYRVGWYDRSVLRDYRMATPVTLTTRSKFVTPGTYFSILIPERKERPYTRIREVYRDVTISYRRLQPSADTRVQLNAIFSTEPWVPSGNTVTLLDVSLLRVDEEAVRDLVISIVELSHPHQTAVIGLRATDDELADIAEIVNAHCEHRILSGEYLQPVLIVGSTFRQTFWVGVKPETFDVLQGRKHPESGDLDYLSASEIGDFSESGEYLLTLNGDNILHACLSDYKQHVVKHTRRRKSAVYIPPALERVPAWVDTRKILATFEGGHTTIACLLATHIAQSSTWLDDCPSIICEEIIDENFVRALAQRVQSSTTPNMYQRIRPRDIEASRQLTLDHNRGVLVLGGVLSSGQTARQLIGLAIRQHYRVLGIAAMIDARTDPHNTIQLWEANYGVHALQQGFPGSTPQGARPRRLVYLDRNGKPAHKPLGKPNWPIATTTAINALGDAGAIHMGHFAGSFDRHFTFYIDIIKALRAEECQKLFIEPVVDKIAHWATKQSPADLLLQFPATELRPESPAEFLTALVASRLREVTARPVHVAPAFESKRRASRPTVYLDWGSVTGESIVRNVNRYLAHGTPTLLYVTLLSQVGLDLETYLTTAKQFRTESDVMLVDIWFATRLPVDAFLQEQCPICNQLSARGRWIETNFAEGFNLEKERLAVRTWAPEAVEHSDPITAMYGRSGERDPRANTQALLRRAELVAARQSVQSAYHALHSVARSIEDPNWLLSLLSLLVFEPQWLRTPPLSSQDLRHNLAEKCLHLLRQSALERPNAVAQATSIIALRLVSKTMYSRNINVILSSVNDEPGLESLCRYMTATILSRDYLVKTGLPELLAEQLTVAEAQANINRASYSDHAYRELEAAYVQAARLRAEGQVVDAPLWEVALKLSLKLNEFQEHRVYEHYKYGADPALLTTGAKEPQACLAAWKRVSRWIHAEISPRVTPLRSYLLLTHALLDPQDYNRVLEDNSSQLLELVDEFNHSVIEADFSPDTDLIAKLSVMYESIRVLFDSAVGSSILLSAWSEVSVPFATLVDDFVTMCREKDVTFIDPGVGNAFVRLLLPSRFRGELVTNIVGNAQKYRSPGKQPEIKVQLEPRGLIDDAKVTVLKIETYGTQEKRRGSIRDRPGGLSELRRMAPDGVKLLSRATRTVSNVFCYVVEVHVPVWNGGQT
jgi:hypothetical protein